MDLKWKQTQLQFQGFLNTPPLWDADAVLGLKQFQIQNQNTFVFNDTLPGNLRLGKRVERFVSAELNRNDDIEVCGENIQIQKDKITLGEIDSILKQHNRPIHLEIVYKFYLYAPHEAHDEIEHWIGPNRRDSLIKKLRKLKDKQLPLLYNNYTLPVLERLNIDVKTVEQQVYFKAQLFLPFESEAIPFNKINQDCVKGFYIRFNAIENFSECKFYFPSKHNWLIEPVSWVNWLHYDTFYEKMQALINEKIASMCWIKWPNGEIKKCFVVWWD
ncbi:DUF1853 family protein [Tamlana crocina]|uniref:DUF1853 family protein n=1 Tax=Tamlana crocina TaxID=393006 RepID=A0ABX1DCM8_9FLAO|nr:DUF1853 family protein [Tamlana crocina]NJX15082.1 DUF1853 family protein [Tamlana crocina]